MERFWSKVDRRGKCWIWTASRDPSGYGFFRLNGRMHKAHRVAWELTHGPLPQGQGHNVCVLHRCDTTSCVNPDHLWLGTQADNVKDMIEKGREVKSRGIHHWRARLTPWHIRKIRRLRALGHSQQTIADIIGTPQTNVSVILRGKTWAHITR
jgi:hypothetical protein